MKILITGGTGLIGTRLVKRLQENGHEPIVLTRPGSEKKPEARTANWDVNAGTIDSWAIGEADAIIHLAGANVADGRWTDERKKELRDSRVKSGRLLAESLKTIPNHVKTFISASAIGYYGRDRQGGRAFKEADLPASDFLGNLSKEWEASVADVTELGIRVCYVRTGIVLAKEGGAYKEFQMPMKFRVRAALGSGNQMVSWIHIDDIVNIYLFLLEHAELSGAYNAVAPAPVSNKNLVKAMAAAKGGPYIPTRVPEFALKLALGEMSVEVLKSTTVSPEKIMAAGFSFAFPGIAGAAKDLARG